MLVAIPVAAVAVVAFATPKAESLSNVIESESDALVSRVVPAVKAQAAEPLPVVTAAPATAAEPVQAVADAQPKADAPEAVVPGDDDKVYDIVEQQPQFPGGSSAMAKWLGDNIKYPAEAAKQGIEGRVIVQFVVGSDAARPRGFARNQRHAEVDSRQAGRQAGGREVHYSSNVPSGRRCG